MHKRHEGWSKEQLERIERWLNEKWGQQRKCPQCDAFQWSVVEPASIPLAKPDGSLIFGPGFPAVIVLCGNCGHLVLVSAFICGAIEQPSQEGKSDG